MRLDDRLPEPLGSMMRSRALAKHPDVELEHRVESVQLGPAVYPRVVSVRNGFPVDGSFKRVRIDTGENRRPGF